MVSGVQRRGTEKVGTRYVIGIRKVWIVQLHERGGTVVHGGGGMFATQDQYRVVPGNGHEIIDHIRCLALSQTLLVCCFIIWSILNRRMSYNDYIPKVSSILLDPLF